MPEASVCGTVAAIRRNTLADRDVQVCKAMQNVAPGGGLRGPGERSWQRNSSIWTAWAEPPLQIHSKHAPASIPPQSEPGFRLRAMRGCPTIPRLPVRNSDPRLTTTLRRGRQLLRQLRGSGLACAVFIFGRQHFLYFFPLHTDRVRCGRFFSERAGVGRSETGPVSSAGFSHERADLSNPSSCALRTRSPFETCWPPRDVPADGRSQLDVPEDLRGREARELRGPASATPPLAERHGPHHAQIKSNSLTTQSSPSPTAGRL